MLTSMDVGVFLHVRLLMEPFTAVLAGIRPGVAVDQQVRWQRAGPLERFPALFALNKVLEKNK